MRSLKYYLAKAQKNEWAVGQFNFSTLEILKSIVSAGRSLKSPLIVGTSEGESRFVGLEEAVFLVKILREENKIPVFLHLDHGKSFRYIKKAIKAGYDSVHFDGSGLSLSKNIEITKRVVDYAQTRGVLVEGEVGVIGNANNRERLALTNPQEADFFVKETGVNSLAISIGNLHGIKKSGVNPHLDLKRLKKIREKLRKRVFLVLHGGSGIQQTDIRKAIALGIVKININTELRIAYTDTLRKILKDNPKEIVPYKYLPKAMEAVQKKVKEKIRLFNSINKLC